MKWFKHMVDAPEDERMCRIFDIYGHWGLSVWWLLVGAVARNMQRGSSKCTTELSIKNWCKITQTRPPKLKQFISFLTEIKLIKSEKINQPYALATCQPRGSRVVADTQLLSITIPKLLELRDTRNQKLPTIGTIEGDAEGDKEINKEKPATPTAKKKPKGRPVPMPKDMFDMYESGTGVPEDFVDWAKSKGVQVDVREIFERFCENHLKKGSEWVSWRAAWQMWIRNAKKYNPEYFLKIANTDRKADDLYEAFLNNIGDGEPTRRDWVLLDSQLRHQCPKHKILGLQTIREKYGKK